MSFWDLPTATHLKQLLLCEQLKDLHNSNNLLRPHTPLPEMNQIVTNAKNKIQNWQLWKTHEKRHELYKRLWRIWETFCDVAGHQWHQTGWRTRGQVSQTVAPGYHDLIIFKHYRHKNKSKTYQIYIMRRTR